MKSRIIAFLLGAILLTGCAKDVETNIEDILNEDASTVATTEETISEEVSGIKIDESSFPDKIFRDYISEIVDKDMNGFLNDEEIESTTSIQVSGSTDDTYHDITSVQGIELFPRLQVLQGADTRIRSIDISGNPELYELDIVNTDISELDLSSNPNLMALYCKNCKNITSLDVTNNPHIQEISISGSGITRLDVTGLSEIMIISCDADDEIIGCDESCVFRVVPSRLRELCGIYRYSAAKDGTSGTIEIAEVDGTITVTDFCDDWSDYRFTFTKDDIASEDESAIYVHCDNVNKKCESYSSFIIETAESGINVYYCDENFLTNKVLIYNAQKD